MAKPLIEVKDLTVYYGNTRALSNVNLEVEEENILVSLVLMEGQNHPP